MARSAPMSPAPIRAAGALSDVEVLVIFQGPGRLTSRRRGMWKKPAGGKVVPTWNYCVVHAHGPLRVRDHRAWLRGPPRTARPPPRIDPARALARLRRPRRFHRETDLRHRRHRNSHPPHRQMEGQPESQPADRAGVIGGLAATQTATPAAMAGLVRDATLRAHIASPSRRILLPPCPAAAVASFLPSSPPLGCRRAALPARGGGPVVRDGLLRRRRRCRACDRRRLRRRCLRCCRGCLSPIRRPASPLRLRLLAAAFFVGGRAGDGRSRLSARHRHRRGLAAPPEVTRTWSHDPRPRFSPRAPSLAS